MHRSSCPRLLVSLRLAALVGAMLYSGLAGAQEASDPEADFYIT